MLLTWKTDALRKKITCPVVTLSTADITWTGPRLSPDLCASYSTEHTVPRSE